MPRTQDDVVKFFKLAAAARHVVHRHFQNDRPDGRGTLLRDPRRREAWYRATKRAERYESLAVRAARQLLSQAT